MATLQPPIASRIIAEKQPGIFTTFMAKQLCANAMFINSQISAVLRSGSSSKSSNCGGASVRVRNRRRSRRSTAIRCRLMMVTALPAILRAVMVILSILLSSKLAICMQVMMMNSICKKDKQQDEYSMEHL